MDRRKIIRTNEGQAKDNQSGMKILFWNAGSLESKLDEFKIRINQVQPTIIAVVETWYTGQEKFNIGINGYTHITKNRTEIKGGGIQILIKDPIQFQEISLTNYNPGKMEILYLEVAAKENFNLLVCYYPKNDLKSSEWDHYVKQLKGQTLIIGDFNSHHPMWEKEKHATNQSGKTIFKFLNDSP